jgi:hypothetical protein
MEIKRVDMEGEIVYLKKNSVLGWKVVYPIRNEDGTINWFNLLTGGSWWNLLIPFFIVLMIILVLYEYTSNIKHFIGCFNNSISLQNCKIAYGYKEVFIP